MVKTCYDCFSFDESLGHEKLAQNKNRNRNRRWFLKMLFVSRHGLPKPNLPDRRSAHEGTLEFCSRDAHRGCKFLEMFSWYILSLVGMSISLAVQIPARKNSCLAKVYKFSPKCTISHQTMQISLQGEKNVIIIPHRDLLAEKNQHYFSPGCPDEKKNYFLTR